MLAIDNLQKSFGDVHVLDGVTLTFAEGETTVIIGPSGAGKSTLLRCLNVLEKPDGGRLIIGDTELQFPTELTRAQMREVRSHSSMVFQSYNLFPHLKVIDNVTLGPVKVLGMSTDEARSLAIELLARVGLEGKEQAYPSSLSGGQAQRVAIARALAMNPDFLLFDEPTSALDPELEREVLDVIARLRDQGRTQVVVTHNMRFARTLADRIIFLEGGSVRFDGCAEAFFTSTDERIRQFLDVYEG